MSKSIKAIIILVVAMVLTLPATSVTADDSDLGLITLANQKAWDSAFRSAERSLNLIREDNRRAALNYCPLVASRVRSEKLVRCYYRCGDGTVLIYDLSPTCLGHVTK